MASISISIKNAIITVTSVSATHARKKQSYRPDAQKKRSDVRDKTAYKTINTRTQTEGVGAKGTLRRGVWEGEVMLVV